MASNLFALDYFAGGVPAGPTLSLRLDELKSLVQRQGKMRRGQDLIIELAFIGLFSYFEAFCKDHFASIINIIPHLVQGLKKDGHDTNIDVTDLSNLKESFAARVGFLLAEKYDFGTPRKVNALYQSLIQVSPFSTNELKKFEKLLADRNLIIHHGGTYTMKYARQAFESEGVRETVFFDLLVVDVTFFNKTLNLIADVGEKTVRATHRRVQKFVEQHNIALSPEQEKALQFLQYWPFGE